MISEIACRAPLQLRIYSLIPVVFILQWGQRLPSPPPNISLLWRKEKRRKPQGTVQIDCRASSLHGASLLGCHPISQIRKQGPGGYPGCPSFSAIGSWASVQTLLVWLQNQSLLSFLTVLLQGEPLMGDLFPGCSRWNCWLWTSLEEIIIYWELSGHPRIPFTTKMGADAARAKEAGPEGGSRPQPQRTPGMCIARSSEKTWTKQTIMNKELHALNTKTSVEMWQPHLFCSFYTCSSATLMLHPASASLIPVLRRASSQMHLKERKSDWGEPGLSLSSHSSWSGYILILTKWLLWVLSPRLLMFKCAYSSRSQNSSLSLTSTSVGGTSGGQ